MEEIKHYATSYALTAKDLYIRFPLANFIVYKEEYRSKLEECARILKYLFYLVIEDIIENDIMFKFPHSPSGLGYLEMKAISGKEFEKARLNGAFLDVDFLASNFTGYKIHLRISNRYRKWYKPIYVGRRWRDRIIELTNQGKLWSTKEKNVNDYIEQVLIKFPGLSKDKIKRILEFGLKRYVWANNMHADIDFVNTTDEITLTLCGRMTADTLRHFYKWLNKWRMKERVIWKMKRKKWDGYYYLGVSQSLHNELKKQTKYKTILNIYLTKIKKELYHSKSVAYIWRIPYPIDCGWKFFVEKLRSDLIEFVEKNKYGNYHKCFSRWLEDGYLPSIAEF